MGQVYDIRDAAGAPREYRPGAVAVLRDADRPAPHLGAYAPDPDRDYRSGWNDCARFMGREPSPIDWQPRIPRRWTRAEHVARALIYLGLPLLLVIAYLVRG